MHSISEDRRYQLLADHAIEFAMIVLDAAGRIVEWSSGAERLFGWRKDEAAGQSIALIFTPEDVAIGVSKAELDNVVVLGRVAGGRWHLRKDGTRVFCDGTVNSLYAEDGKTLLGYGKIMHEADARKRRPDEHASAIAEQRSFLAAVLESVENGIVACDADGRLTFFNDAARALHGLEKRALPFEAWPAHYHLYRGDGTTLLAVDEIPLYRALKGERVERARIVVAATDGTRRELEVTGRPIEDATGQVMGAVVSMHDVTAREEARDARDETAREQTRRFVAEAAEDRLRAAQARLRLATDAAHLGIWTWDVERDHATWDNERMHQIFHVPVDDGATDAARSMVRYLHPDDAARFLQARDDAIASGKALHFVGRFRVPNEDAPRWVELHGVFDDGTRPVIIGTAADITVRKRSDEELLEARIRSEATLSAGEVASWIWDIRSDRVIADRNLARLFGVPEHLSTGAPLAMYTRAIHPADLAEVQTRIQTAIETNEPYRVTYRVAGADRAYRWVDARGRIEYDAQGQPTILAGITVDITQQKETQERLRLTEERYRTLISSMDEAFAIVRVLVDERGEPVDYRFEEVNQAFEQQSGLVDAGGKTIREMVPRIEPHWIEIYGRVARNRKSERFVEHSAEMGYWWDVYATPMGEPEELRIAILFKDVTARMRAEENLRQVAADLSEADRRKTEFLATLAHELRNPLAPLRTGLDLMRRTAKSRAEDARLLDVMDRQMRQMVHLIDDLMDVSRINSGKIVLKKERTDLAVAVTHAVETSMPAIEGARHRLQVRLPEQPVVIDADQTRLAQVLGNLLTNAVKYTPEGGHIEVDVRSDGAAGRVTVTDSGIGIPPEEQAGVFEMFSQVSRHLGRAQGGLGIGLSLVRSLVMMHGGSISVDSRGAGQGSAFTVSLPLASSRAAAAAGGDGAQAAPDAPRRRLRIVVADDNVDAADMLGQLLQAAGHEVDTVHGGRDAVRRIVDVKPDLAILDIGMPGLNGYEVARAIRVTPGLERVMLATLTGWGGEQDRRLSEEAGFDAHLTKPASMADLERLLTRALDRERGGPG